VPLFLDSVPQFDNANWNQAKNELPNEEVHYNNKSLLLAVCSLFQAFDQVRLTH
jgi:hypothetical protein